MTTIVILLILTVFGIDPTLGDGTEGSPKGNSKNKWGVTIVSWKSKKMWNTGFRIEYLWFETYQRVIFWGTGRTLVQWQLYTEIIAVEAAPQ